MEQLFTTKEVAARIGLKSITLDKWRCSRPPRGPRYIRVGGRIRYPADAVEKWLQSRSFDPAALKPRRRRAA